MQSAEYLTAQQRLDRLFDQGEYRLFYRRRESGGKPAGVLCAHGRVNGMSVCAFSQDHSCNAGALGSVQVDMLRELYAFAGKIGCPIIGIYDSDGAWVDGSAKPLQDYGTLIQAASALSGVVPQIAVVAGPCLGSAAIWAASADFLLMTRQGRLYTTPNSAETIQDAVAAGLVSAVAEDDSAGIHAVRQLLSYLPANNLASVPRMDPVDPVQQTAAPAGVADAGSIFLLGTGFGMAATIMFAAVDGIPVGMIALSGALRQSDCLKAARFLRICDAFSIPVITMMDTVEYAENGMAEIRAMTRLAGCYGEATTGLLSVVTGQAVGTVCAAMIGSHAADVTIALEDAVIAPLAPLTAAEFLYHDRLKGSADLGAARKQLANQYATELAGAAAAAENGCVDLVIPADTLRAVIADALHMLAGKRVATLPKKHHTIPF